MSRAFMESSGASVWLCSRVTRPLRDLKFFDREGLDMDRATERKVENVFFREDFRRVAHDRVGRILDYARVGEAYGAEFLARVERTSEIAALIMRA